MKGEENLQKVGNFVFRERERDFSLDYRAIRLSEFFGARRKVVLHDEAYA